MVITCELAVFRFLSQEFPNGFCDVKLIVNPGGHHESGIFGPMPCCIDRAFTELPCKYTNPSAVEIAVCDSSVRASVEQVIKDYLDICVTNASRTDYDCELHLIQVQLPDGPGLEFYFYGTKGRNDSAYQLLESKQCVCEGSLDVGIESRQELLRQAEALIEYHYNIRV